jgi:DNA-directed RNA polymerase beta' subunit
MIKLLDLEKVTKGLRPVTSTEYNIGKSTSFHPDGLFSETIFGAVGSTERGKTFSYINLHCLIVHPALIKPLEQLNRKVILAINRKAAYKLQTNGYLQEDKDGEINSLDSVNKNFNKIFDKPEESKIRKDMRNMLLSYHKRGMVFISKCIVMPTTASRDAQVDEVHGGFRIPPINDYYLKIIRQSLQLDSMSLSSGPMYDILSCKMQQLVDDLYEYIVEKISKKQGMIRQDILGKRADFTGRAVVTGAAGKIRVDEIGIPLRILVKLYEPFILYDMYNSGNVNRDRLSTLIKEWDNSTLSILTIRALLTSIQKGFKISSELEDLVKGSVTRAIADKVVLAKRDPALHSESVQGFKPILTDGDTIQLSIAKCKAYNADFDGDQMALYVPITREAIAEARDKMVSSESKDSLRGISDDFSKDMVIGIYALTQDSPSKKAPIIVRSDDDLKKLEPLDIIKYDGQVTTVGRVLFNKILPHRRYYSNKPINKKDIKNLAENIYNDYIKEKQVYIEFCHQFVNLSMLYYTIMAPSFTLDDLMDIPKEILELKKKLGEAKNPTDAGIIVKQIESSLQTYVETKNTNIGLIGKAGGLKNGYNQTSQILVAKGMINTPNGVKVIKGSYADGFNSEEYFNGGFGSRKGIIDRVLNTSDTGYLSRQLVYALQRVEADPRVVDCKTKRFFTLKATPEIAKRLMGRNIIDKAGKIIPFNKDKHTDKVIHLRSPLYCTSKRICRTCYGELLMRNRTKYVGVLAGQICGEVLTQTIMRTFHVGGSINMKTVNITNELTNIMEDSDKSYFMKSFKQDGTKLISLINGSIEIIPSEYKEPKKDILIEKDKIDLNYAFFALKYMSYVIDVTIDAKIEIDLKDKKIIQSDDKIIIEFSKGSVVMDCLPTPEIFSEQIKVIDATLSGRTPIRLNNGDHFCLKLYNIYRELSGADLIHFEILACNLLRDKGNPSYPARLNPNYGAVIRSLKSIPKLESWLQSLAFENPKESITTGLIYDRPIDETILEKLITGNF